MSDTHDEEVLVAENVGIGIDAEAQEESLPFVWPRPVDTRLYDILQVKEHDVKTGDVVMLKLDEPSTEFGGGYIISQNKDGSRATYWDKTIHVACFVESVTSTDFVVKKVEPEQIKSSMCVIQRPKVVLSEEKPATPPVEEESVEVAVGKKHPKTSAHDDSAPAKRKKTAPLVIELYGVGQIKSIHHKEFLRIAGTCLGVNLVKYKMPCGTTRVRYVPPEESSDNPKTLESTHEILDKINSLGAKDLLEMLKSPNAQKNFFGKLYEFCEKIAAPKASSSNAAMEVDNSDVHCVDDDDE